MDSKTLQKIALENEINLFYPDANSATLSLNEATTCEDFDRLVHVFELMVIKKPIRQQIKQTDYPLNS